MRKKISKRKIFLIFIFILCFIGFIYLGLQKLEAIREDNIRYTREFNYNQKDELILQRVYDLKDNNVSYSPVSLNKNNYFDIDAFLLSDECDYLNKIIECGDILAYDEEFDKTVPQEFVDYFYSKEYFDYDIQKLDKFLSQYNLNDIKQKCFESKFEDFIQSLEDSYNVSRENKEKFLKAINRDYCRDFQNIDEFQNYIIENTEKYYDSQLSSNTIENLFNCFYSDNLKISKFLHFDESLEDRYHDIYNYYTDYVDDSFNNTDNQNDDVYLMTDDSESIIDDSESGTENISEYNDNFSFKSTTDSINTPVYFYTPYDFQIAEALLIAFNEKYNDIPLTEYDCKALSYFTKNNFRLYEDYDIDLNLFSVLFDYYENKNDIDTLYTLYNGYVALNKFINNEFGLSISAYEYLYDNTGCFEDESFRYN